MTGQATAEAAEQLSSAPVERPPGLGVTGWARWAWRQLTSMRIALVLLFLLALASVPGSLVPQQSLAPFKVSQFRAKHTVLAPFYDKLQLFHVYTSVWFSAIYLLLFVSLAGCILPRCAQFARALRARPPAAPSRLNRLPLHATWRTDAEPEAVLTAAHRLLRGRRFRTVRTGGAVAAEKGYLREAGNLGFHISLFLLLGAFAVSRLFGGSGTAIVVEGESFANTATQYDDFMPGAFYTTNDLTPFGFTLDRFQATYQTSGSQLGTPRTFAAKVRYWKGSSGPARAATIEVNEPLEVGGGTKVFLTAHGYAPVVTVRDSKGRVSYTGPTPCLPQDSFVTSTCAIKVPDYTDGSGKPVQLGFQGIFAPTAVVTQGQGPHSVFPGLNNPGLFLTGYSGDLGLDAGTPQSVYQLDVKHMKQFTVSGQPLSVALHVGQGFKLPTGGTLTFEGVRQWANFTVSRNPGNGTALAGSVAAIAGLIGSLFVRRRRIWVRATAGPDGATTVELAGLARSQSPATAAEVNELLAQLQHTAPSLPEPQE